MEEKQKENLIDEEVADVSTVSDQPLEIDDEAKKSEEELEKIAPVDSNQVLKTKSPSKKILIGVLFIAINLLAILTTVVIEFTGEEHPVPLSSVWNTFSQNIGWGICGLLMFVCSILCDTLKRYTLLKSTLKKSMPLTALKATIICRYYDNITPLGSGGQPFEIFYMRKKGIPVGIASGAPIVGYALERIAYVFVAVVTILFYGFGDTSLFITILCIVGLIANAFIPFAIFFFTVMPKVAKSVSYLVAKIAKKLHVTKDEKAFAQKITGSMSEYANCLKYFTQKSRISMLKGFIYSCLQFLAIYSIPFFAVRLSGNQTASWGETFALCVICYTSVTLLPTPGNSGGAELSFRSIFASYLSGGLLFWGMLTWRLLSYYTFVLTGLSLLLGQQIRKLIIYKRHPEIAHKGNEPLVHEPVAQENKEEASSQNNNFTNENVVNDEFTYTLPAKAVEETENIKLAETVIEAETTIETQENVEEENIIPPDDAETLVDIEVVIESSNKTVIVEHVEENEQNNSENNAVNSLDTQDNSSNKTQTLTNQNQDTTNQNEDFDSNQITFDDLTSNQIKSEDEENKTELTSEETKTVVQEN